jgi:uncharacterized protein YbjQ (UPF0145 family)
MSSMTSFSGNEIFCLSQKKYLPGQPVFGNCIHSLGFSKKIESDIRNRLGSELLDISAALSSGRELSLQRMMKDANEKSVAKIKSQIRQLSGMIEFFVTGSDVLTASSLFSTHANGQELYLQLDAGFQPLSYVAGNVAISTGVSSGLIGQFKNLSSGELIQYSDQFNETRHIALEKIIKKAESLNANVVLGINMENLVFSGITDMFLSGTAALHEQLSNDYVATSHLSFLDTWNLAKLGYIPQKFILNSVVFSMGMINNIRSSFRGLTGGESLAQTQLVDFARKKALSNLQNEANEIRADRVVGVQTFLFQLGNGIMECLAIGTAIQKSSKIKTDSEQIIPQAVYW